MSERLLILDDDAGICKVLSVTLAAAGYLVTTVSTGEQALVQFENDGYDLALLDVNLPGMSGRSVCRELRSRACAVPIIMLSVRDTEQDKVDAFSVGADDYMTKPFSVRELIARVQALLRRSRKNVVFEVQREGDTLELEASELLVVHNGRKIKLTPTQYRILETLMKAQGKTVPYTALLADVWGAGFRDRTEYLRVFVRQLRILLEEDPANPDMLQTVQHVGYRLMANRTSLVTDREKMSYSRTYGSSITLAKGC